MSIEELERLPIYAAAAAAAIYFARGVRYLVRKVDQIEQLTSRELDHNHGGSMKDDVHGLAVSVGQLQRERDRDRSRWNTAIELAARHHPEDAPLFQALRKGPRE